MTGTYRYLGSTLYRRDGSVVEYGDVFEPTDGELEAFGDVMEPVDGSAGSDDADAADAETCGVIKADGDVCGRELPCRFHTDDEGE